MRKKPVIPMPEYRVSGPGLQHEPVIFAPCVREAEAEATKRYPDKRPIVSRLPPNPNEHVKTTYILKC